MNQPIESDNLDLDIDIDSLLDEMQDDVDSEVEETETKDNSFSDSEIPGVLTYDLETVPDESRFPAPKKVQASGVGDVEVLLSKTANEIKKEVSDATEDELLDMRAKEASGPARKTVLSYIDGEVKSRSSEFEKWVKSNSVDPFRCKICAIGWSVGRGEIRSMTAQNEDEEREILKAFWRLASESEKGESKPRTRIGFGITRFDDVVIANRSIALGIKPSFRLMLKKYGNKQAVDLEQLIFQNTKVVAAKSVARAWSISIPEPEMDGSQVYELFQAEEMDKIASYVRSDVYVEREMYEIAHGMFE
jgi:hypothetical protein